MCFTETNKSTDRENNCLWYLLCIYLDLLVIFRCFSFFQSHPKKRDIFVFVNLPGNVDFSIKTSISGQLLVYQLIYCTNNLILIWLIDKPVIVLICLCLLNPRHSLLKNRRFQVGWQKRIYHAFYDEIEKKKNIEILPIDQGRFVRFREAHISATW